VGGHYIPVRNSHDREHFVAAASAAANVCASRVPRAERGAKLVMRAFARDAWRGQSISHIY
jgi:hypothetical protein